MKQHSVFWLLALGPMVWGEAQAQQTASTTFRVSARVQALCEVSASDLDFGTYSAQGSSPLQGSRIWGNTPGTDTVTGVGTGLAQDHTVFGSIPAAQVIPAGDYADTITVRIYY